MSGFKVRFADGGEKRLTLKALVGAKVRTAVPISTGAGQYPQGAEAVVVSAAHGLTLKGDPCRCCGVGIYMRKVPVSMVEVVAMPEGNPER